MASLQDGSVCAARAARGLLGQELWNGHRAGIGETDCHAALDHAALVEGIEACAGTVSVIATQ